MSAPLSSDIFDIFECFERKPHNGPLNCLTTFYFIDLRLNCHSIVNLTFDTSKCCLTNDAMLRPQGGKPTEYRLTGIPPSNPLLIGSLNMHYSDVRRDSGKAAFEVLLLEYRVANQ